MSAKGQESNGNLLPEEYEGHLAAVTKQLENIQTTQDSILAELSDDISNLQFENVQLKNTNEHLTYIYSFSYEV
jgi:DNA repair ATPase RecN